MRNAARRVANQRSRANAMPTLTHLLALLPAIAAEPESPTFVGGGRHGHAHERRHARLFPANPVPCRNDLADAARMYFYKTGHAVEVGVNQGRLSKIFLSRWNGTYTMVDPWRGPAFGYSNEVAFTTQQDKCVACCQSSSNCDDRTREVLFRDKDWRPFWHDIRSKGQCKPACDANTSAVVVDDVHLAQTRANTRFAGKRAHIMRMTGNEAAMQFEDEHFDFIYLDAVHTYEGPRTLLALARLVVVELVVAITTTRTADQPAADGRPFGAADGRPPRRHADLVPQAAPRRPAGGRRLGRWAGHHLPYQEAFGSIARRWL